jgi:dolichol-phosphate mannosyltransferase
MSHFPELSLSVVLPAYNEERLIEATVRRAVGSLQRAVGRFELLLVDDCSSDRTPELADALAHELPQVRAIHNPRNLRQGGCLKIGFELAQYELVTHNAADCPFDFDDLPRVLAPFPAADVVVVTRRSYPGVSTGRRFVSWGNRSLIRVLFGLDITDYNFIQVYRRAVLAKLECFSTATAFITVERIVRAHHAGYRVVAVDADYHRREAGVSSSGNLRVVRDSFRDMLRLWLQLKRSPATRTADQTEPNRLL